MRYESAFHATHDKETADEMTAKMDVIIDIKEALSVIDIKNIDADLLLDFLEGIKKDTADNGNSMAKQALDNMFGESLTALSNLGVRS